MTVDPIELSRSAVYADRERAVVLLRQLVARDAAAFERLVEMLNDEDTGVGFDAAIALIDQGGPAGVAAVLRENAVSPSQSTRDWMGDALRNAWVDGGFVLDGPLTELRDHHPDELVRKAARRALQNICKIPQDEP